MSISSSKDSGSYIDLKRRIFQRVRSQGIGDRIREVVQIAYEAAIKTEGTTLTRPEHKRLQSQVLKLVLDEMSQGLESGFAKM